MISNVKKLKMGAGYVCLCFGDVVARKTWIELDELGIIVYTAQGFLLFIF